MLLPNIRATITLVLWILYHNSPVASKTTLGYKSTKCGDFNNAIDILFSTCNYNIQTQLSMVIKLATYSSLTYALVLLFLN